MNDLQANTPSISQSITDETIVGCMRKSKSLQDWEMREKNFRLRLGEDFNKVWVRVILLSGVAEEMLKGFDDTVNPWQDIKISDRVAPL